MLPSLRSIFRYDAFMTYGRPDFWTHLALDDFVDCHSGGHVAKSPKGLKNFAYLVDPARRMVPGYSGTFQRPLRNHKSMLENLSLTLDSIQPRVFPRLKNFSKLRRLHLDFKQNFTSREDGDAWLLDVLPPDLKVLRLSTSGERFVHTLFDPLKHVLINKNASIPSLAELIVEPMDAWKIDAASSTCVVSPADLEIIQLAESAGISLLVPYKREHVSLREMLC